MHFVVMKKLCASVSISYKSVPIFKRKATEPQRIFHFSLRNCQFSIVNSYSGVSLKNVVLLYHCTKLLVGHSCRCLQSEHQ